MGRIAPAETRTLTRTLLCDGGIEEMNTCTLVGILERAPTVIDSEGPLQARFTLRVEETGKDGKVYPLFVACECYGQLATRSAATLAPISSSWSGS